MVGGVLQTPRSGNSEPLGTEPQPISARIAARRGQGRKPRSASVCPCPPTPCWTVNVERQEHASFYVICCLFLQLLPGLRRTGHKGQTPVVFLPPRQMSPFLPGGADSTQAAESDPTAAIPHHGQGRDSGPVIRLVQCPARNPGQGRPVQAGEPWGHSADAPEFASPETGLGSKRETESASC